MLATGDLYYYGARGLARDQVLAFQYYSRAAAVHDPMGLCGAAAMYLKGEGMPVKNVSQVNASLYCTVLFYPLQSVH